MVYLSRIYTKTGDAGDTALGDGSRVPKDHPRVAAYGAVDELNAALGLLVAAAADLPERDLVRSLQNDLFDVGADLCVPAAAWCHLARTVARRAERAVVTLMHAEAVNPQVLAYLNRLSDLLFVLGRVLNDQGRADVLWVPGGNR